MTINAVVRGDEIGHFAYTHVAVFRRGLYYLTGVIEEYEEQDICHAALLQYKEGGWKHWPVSTRVIGISAFDAGFGPTVLAAGFDGNTLVASPTGIAWESVGRGPEMPSSQRHLTCIRRIGQHVYVAGMARQVFRRLISGGAWERADKGALIARNALEINGFLAIDGLNENDMYASGFHGHLWHFAGDHWRQVDSPTNLKITCLRCLSDKIVIAGGGDGLILRGFGDQWRVLDQDVTTQTFVSTEVFSRSVYFTTEGGKLFRLTGDELAPVDFGFEPPALLYSLHASDGVLLAAGGTDAILFDGTSWSRLESPFRRS